MMKYPKAGALDSWQYNLPIEHLLQRHVSNIIFFFSQDFLSHTGSHTHKNSKKKKNLKASGAISWG